MFRDELDMLECRLTEMQDWPVVHVLVEAAVSHRGDPKPLWYAKCRDRFAAWEARIVYVEAKLPSREEAPGMDPWDREHSQRDAAGPVLDMGADPQDLVLIADVDEIPSRAVLEVRPSPALSVTQKVAAFAVDWLFPSPEPTSVLVRAGVVNGQLALARDARHLYPSLPEGGWHLSWLGGDEAIRRKTAAHCHREYDEALLRGVSSGLLYERGRGVWGADLVPAEVDETWPRWVYERRCPEGWFRPREEQ
jgi:hypothetical protein